MIHLSAIILHLVSLPSIFTNHSTHSTCTSSTTPTIPGQAVPAGERQQQLSSQAQKACRLPETNYSGTGFYSVSLRWKHDLHAGCLHHSCTTVVDPAAHVYSTASNIKWNPGHSSAELIMSLSSPKGGASPLRFRKDLFSDITGSDQCTSHSALGGCKIPTSTVVIQR